MIGSGIFNTWTKFSLAGDDKDLENQRAETPSTKVETPKHNPNLDGTTGDSIPEVEIPKNTLAEKY